MAQQLQPEFRIEGTTTEEISKQNHELVVAALL